MTANEKSIAPQDAANIETVQAFIAAWNDPDRGVEYLAPTAAVRMDETKPAVVGRNAYLDAWSVAPQGFSVEVQYHGIYACNPLVVASHLDIIRTPGNPDQVIDLVGVFVVKGGKITEWTDYLLNQAVNS